MARSRPRSDGEGAERHEPQGIGSVVRDLLGQAPLRRGVPLGRLSRSWEEVVGPELAAHTAPRSLEQGQLVVAAASAAWGAQVRFLAGDIRRRANRALGRDDVRSVRVTVASDSRKPLRRNASETDADVRRIRGTDPPG